MLDDIQQTGQPPEPTFPPTLSDLSRNASVISSSSDSEASTTSLIKTPRPRPTRTFSSPRSRSPHSPPSHFVRPPPAYLTRELGVSEESDHRDPVPQPVPVPRPAQARSKSRKPSRSRNPSANARLSAEDFVFGETLGEGSYSTVMRARYARTGQEYAIKILDKNHLIRKDKMLVALAEKNTLVKLGAGHPGIIRLHWTFQDEYSLFFVLDLAPNGEMRSRILHLGSLSLTCARYYTAQIVDAIEYMHDKDVIHRDLKPENLLLDAEFRMKVTDFGTGKILENGQDRANSFVGTAQYVSPELLERNETSKSSDLWSLGCIVFQMIAGRFAFQGLSEYLTWQKIKSLDYSFPEGFDEDAKDFVSKLLVRDPQQRLGVSRTPGSPSPLRTHPFLASINWSTLWTDPPPRVEPGLVKKQLVNQSDGEDARWNDVSARWDALVGNGDVGETEGTMVVDSNRCSSVPRLVDDDDGIAWAEDAHGAEFEKYKLRDAGAFKRVSRILEEVGPMGELPDYSLAAAIVSVTPVESSAGMVGQENADKHLNPNPSATVDVAKAAEEKPLLYTTTITETSMLSSTSTTIPIPSTIPRNGIAAGGGGRESGTNSSDGSLADKSAIVTAIASLELERGRNRELTPVQGNGWSCCLPDFSSLLTPGETILFSTQVEARSPKRRGSKLRLISVSVSPIRSSKNRQLVLTTHRLLCVKQRPEGGVGLKSELSLRKGSAGTSVEKVKDKDKDKDSKSVVESAERKGEREFVVLTSTQTQTYATESSGVASQWVQKINAVLFPVQR